MQRLNSHLAPLWVETHQQQRPENVRQHHDRVEELIDEANSQPQLPIPAHLHHAGHQQVIHATSGDIALLRLGRAIALATRALLPDGPGNQRLALAATNGTCMARMLGARRTTPPAYGYPASETTEITAELSVLAAGGACAEHAAVALELALSTGNTARIYSSADDHSFVMLAPERGIHAVVIDGWTTFPTSCLSADSTFFRNSVIVPQADRPPGAIPFNLHTIERLRHRLEEALGPEPILQAILQDRVAVNYLPFPDPASDAPVPRNAGAFLLQDAASMIGSAPIREVTLRQSNLAGNQRPRYVTDNAVRQHLYAVATNASHALMPMVAQLARLRAMQSPLRRGTVRFPMDCVVPLGGTMQGHIQLTLRAVAQATVRDARLPSANILYCDDTGATFSTTTAPQALIDAAQQGLDNAETLDFPDGFRDQKPEDTRFALARLQHAASQPVVALTADLQHTALEIIDVNLPALPIDEQADVLLQLDGAQLTLQPAQRQVARNILDRHYARLA
ncbi:hypothetical protein QN362_12060 [Actimicrobium sp. CCC2.4]|uniref:hypothetical protein n=1 Tax=Actimicrobium sp. CCC2.4 TaxID=3048606 RepID=UPI002AC8C008|nr:hypothetical protein [Actimicrobium sp. CCC2.4]MEB0136066.1 hypothetical protein [Actimicrobium sp. CCC2.4]WPX32176.1 hypothetical protein RHM62_18440 [Actimicrobium sp. CCC2.4]